MNRWSKSGVLDRVFAQLQHAQIIRMKIEAIALDSAIVKVHSDGTGALKKNGPQAIGQSRGGWFQCTIRNASFAKSLRERYSH